MSDADKPIVDAVLASRPQARRLARADSTRLGPASHPAVASPIVGATKPEHLEDAVAAVELVLSDDEVATLEEKYRPHGVVGFQ